MISPTPARPSDRIASSTASDKRLLGTARWFMLAGAALEVVAAVIGIETESSTAAAFAAGARPRPGAALLQELVSAHGETILATSVVACAIWLVMAYANRSGGTTARLISTYLFFGCSKATLQAFHEPDSGATLAITVVIWLVALAATALLWVGPIRRRIGRRASRRVAELSHP